MSIIPSCYHINREAFKDFINGSEIIPDDGRVKLAVEDVIKSRLSPEILRRAQVSIFKGDTDKLKKRIGFASFNGHPILSAHKLIEFPFFNEEGKIILYRYKLIPSSDGAKYLHPRDTSPYPYILPEVYDIKNKPHIAIYITEGEKKALKLLQHGIYAIGLVGVWGFKAGKNSDEVEEDKALWGEFEKFTWKGRIVNLAFDSDLWTNPQVRKALYELAVKLHLRGAIVKFLSWKPSEGKGIDDYLVFHENAGTEAEAVIEQLGLTAQSLIDFISYDHINDIIRALAFSGYKSFEARQLIDGLSTRLDIKVSILKDAIREKHAEITRADRALNQNVYFIHDEHLCRWSFSKDGKVPVRLANFQARIVEEIIEDNGIEQIHKYHIEGAQKDKRLKLIEVPASTFQSMSWIYKWGNRAVIEPGFMIKDYVRHATQITSDPKTILCYTHTGWRNIEDKWVYLSSTGGIGGDVQVKLSREIKRYALPFLAPTNEKEAIQLSLSFLGIGKKEITLPLFSILYLSVLTTLLEPQPNFSGYLYGESGCYKTTLALLLLSHFGNFQSANNLSNFEDTANALMRRAFTLKDILMVVDDYHPTTRSHDTKSKETIAQRLIRSFANRTDRGRLNPDGSEKGRHEPRGMLLITGEDLVSVQSTLARALVIEMKKGDIDVEKMTELQKNIDLLPSAMFSFISWLRDRIDDIRKEFPERFMSLRTLAFKDDIHRRLPELSAFLQFSYETILSWAVDKKVIPEKDKFALMAGSWEIFKDAIKEHSDRLHREDPVEKFKDILSTLIAQGKVRLDGKNNSDSIMGSGMGEIIGYHDEDFLYLIPSGIWKSVQVFCRDSNTHFPVSKNTLYQMLRNRGIIKDHEEDRNTVRIKIAGRTIRVLKVIKDIVI
jgi:hypothetical protein